MMLTLSQITKSYGYQTVLAGVSLTLHDEQRVGLVGANGVGKSTLLKIIAGEVEADSGTVLLESHRRIGYLAQVIQSAHGYTLADLITASQAHIYALESQLRDLEAQMASSDAATRDAAMTHYGDVLDAFERYGGYELDSAVDRVFAGLRVSHLPRDRAFNTFSGGEKARVGLALLLLQAPDLLLLDEPTNHLDWESLAWLEGYLSGYRGAALIVSHDRLFLNRTVNVIIEIDEHSRTSKRYTGDYDHYRQVKARAQAQWVADYASQQDEIKRLRIEVKEVSHRNSNYRAHADNDKFVRNIKIATHDQTVSRRVRQAQEKLDRILRDPIPAPPDALHFRAEFDAQALNGRYPLMVSGLSKRYAADLPPVLDAVSFSISQNSRVALVGENGAGKSTLLRLLMGIEAPDRGEVQFSAGVRVGYLDQENSQLNLDLTLAAACADGLTETEQQIKAILLRSGLFHVDDLEKRVGDLSVGQQRKLQIARLMIGKANVLILDEPTNHISFEVLESLETALQTFNGAVLVATHDRRFLERFDGEIWRLHAGQLLKSQPTPTP